MCRLSVVLSPILKNINYEFWLSLCKIVRSSVILLLLLFSKNENVRRFWNNIPRLKIKILESQNILKRLTFSFLENKSNNKITELRTILQRESQNS
jgi:hypothetical protein